MQAKPLVLTLVVFGVLAFGADIWLANSTDQAVLNQSQLTPVPSRSMLRVDSLLAAERSSEAITLADSLDETRSVTQKIQDLTIAARIEKRLFSTRDLRNIVFDVISVGGEVTVTGTVPSELDRRHAIRAAQGVQGVKKVIDKVKVITPPAVTSSPGS